MNQVDRNSWGERDGVATLMPDAAQSGTPGPGVMIGGFQLQSLLGRGGMGEVWKAWDIKAERPVVLKLVPPELQRAGEEMARVKTTFQRVYTLQHQHICPLYLLDEDTSFGWYLVMKYIDGQTLSTYHATYAARHGSFPVEQVVKILHPVAEALDYAHAQRVIHRDIKPQNILVVGDGADVQVVDFGLAEEIRTTVSRYTQVQMDTSGTRPYMAPEQWKGQFQDARTDQYALAVVAYELLADRLPFESADFDILRACVLNDPPERIDRLPPAVNRALLLGLAKRREERFATCCALVEALAGSAGIESPRPGLSREPAAPAIPGELASGECVQCHTRNEPHRKFCRECAAPLRVPCLNCAVEIPVWDKVCPECGAIQADVLAARQRELGALQTESEKLLREYAFDRAAQIASKLAAEQDRRLHPFKDWAATFLQTVAEEKSRQEENARTLFSEAKTHRKTYDYAAAIDALARVPKPMLTPEMSSFLARLVADQNEAATLLPAIQERVKQRDLDGLLPQVTRAIELRGPQPDLQRLQQQLQQRESRLTSQRDQQYAEAKRRLEQGQAKEALALVQAVETKQLRPSDIQLRQQLETIVQKEVALASLVAKCKADGLIAADDLVTLLTATFEYRSLNPHNPKVNALHEQLIQQLHGLPADAFSRISPERFAAIPIDLLATLPLGRLATLPINVILKLPANLLVRLSVDLLTKYPAAVAVVAGVLLLVFLAFLGVVRHARRGDVARDRLPEADVSAPIIAAPAPAKLPPSSPPPAIAPFDAVKAKNHQTAWANHLGVSIEMENSIGMRFVLIPPGEFLMGSLDSNSSADRNEKPQHLVRISKPFYLGVTEVTQEQYEWVMATNPSRFNGAQLPVEQVSWEDAVEFCRHLSAQPAEWSADRLYRLPTEAEWEYACRAGSNTKCSFGVSESLLGDYAWYSSNSGSKTQAVGQKKPNAWGLYDMHGNVWEWCSDWFGDYVSTTVSDPTGATAGSNRVNRGGSWLDGARDCRSAYRHWDTPVTRNSYLGFRVAFSLVDASSR